MSDTGQYALMMWDVLRCQTCGALVHVRDEGRHTGWHAALTPTQTAALLPLNSAAPNDLTVQGG